MMGLLGRFYSWLWRPTAGRPWTYEIRDWSERHPGWALLIALPVTVAFVAGQVQLVIMFGWWAAPFVVFADFMSFTAGHLFWDTAGAYIKAKRQFRRAA